MIVAISFLLSMAYFIVKNPGSRRVFYFENRATGKIATEIRYLKRNSAQGKYTYFIDELLLGPVDVNLNPIFSHGTKVDFCFLRGSTLYVNLTKEAVYENNGALPVKTACKILEKNVKKNFPSIKTVALYIDNNETNY